MATDERTALSPPESIRERALWLAAEAARATTYAERRELEQAALRCWQADRAAGKAVRA